jgi:2-hydroxycyclohexanecarboxyl-CoA dehydrogenase
MKRAAFVTGGASGTGLSICEHLARTGHSIAVADYNGDGAEHAAS